MKLLTKEIERKLPALYSQEKNPDPTVQLKYFTPWSGWTWYITEGEQRDGDWLFFGLVDPGRSGEAELGYVALSELQSVKGPCGLGIERDLYFTPKPLSAFRKTAVTA